MRPKSTLQLTPPPATPHYPIEWEVFEEEPALRRAETLSPEDRLALGLTPGEARATPAPNEDARRALRRLLP